MSILLSNKVRLIITDRETTDFDFSINKATELAITGDISIEKSTSTSAYGGNRLVNRVSKSQNTGYTEATVSFSTYIKPSLDGTNISSPEKLLWESLASSDTVDNPAGSTVSFSSPKKLREIFIYAILENGNYYKISRAVVSEVYIDISISSIAKADWSIKAIDYELITTAFTETNIKVLDKKSFVRNKLSTVSIDLSGTSYVLALISASVLITNELKVISRKKVNAIQVATGFFVQSRATKISIEAYTNTQVNGSLVLETVLNSYTNITDIGAKANCTISIGGINNSTRVDVVTPICSISKDAGSVGKTNTVNFNLYPEESAVGALDDLVVVYRK